MLTSLYSHDVTIVIAKAMTNALHHKTKEVTVHNVNGSHSNGPIRCVKVTLKPMEIQIFR